MAAKKRKLTALKRIRQTLRRTARRRAIRSAVRSIARAARELGTQEALRAAQATFDRAAARGSIHKNAAARRKSRLMKAAAKKKAQA